MIKWFNRTTSLIDSGLFQGFTDCHSHILPGVDDGFGSLDRSLAALAYMEELGVEQIWLTPHIMEDIPNTTEQLRSVFEELCRAYGGGIKLHLAAEYMLDNLFMRRLEQGDLLPMEGKMLLVETSYMQAPVHLYDTLGRIQAAGYFPLLAHPERYMYMQEPDYKKLKTQGVKLQLNLTSLAGAYGAAPKRKAEQLLAAGMYDASGTDIHSLSAFRRAIEIKNVNAKSIRAWLSREN
jgi:tyrosine-protein phosphatase YwqE